MALIQLDSSGRCGANGVKGYEGPDAPYHGRLGCQGSKGGDGGPAGLAQRGEDGGQVELTLRTAPDRVGVMTSGVSKISGVFCTNYAIGALGGFEISARGGKGGDGGRGGDGGAGGRGVDASNGSYRNGSDGGDGGEAGMGTNGGDGGHGGYVHVRCTVADSYLLMLVRDLCAPAVMVVPGQGGTAGSHGNPGPGGEGGSGAPGYYETHSRRVTKTDSYGNSYTDTEYYNVYVPPGLDGHSGRPGLYPPTNLVPGRNGNPGRVVISLLDDFTGLETHYDRRYDLGIVSMALGEAISPNSDGQYEFGETVFAFNIRVRNVGGMPLPPSQRVRFTPKKGEWLAPDPTEIFIPANTRLLPGEEIVVDGGKSLSFTLLHPDVEKLGDDFGPIVRQERVMLDAFQLGWEAPGADGAMALFQRPYESLNNACQCATAVVMRYPIENTDGLLGSSSLAPGESCTVSLNLSNISDLAIGWGATGKSRRRVAVQFTLAARGELGMERENDSGTISFSDVYNQWHSVVRVGDIPGYVGYFGEIPEIMGRESVFMMGRCIMGQGVPLYFGGGMQAVIWLEDVNQPGVWRLIQKRVLPIRCEPTFPHPTCTSQAVLVTSSNTCKGTFDTWQRVIGKRLGYDVAVWSVSRYGGLDIERLCGPKCKLMVILDDLITSADGRSISTHDLIPHATLPFLLAKGHRPQILVASPHPGEGFGRMEHMLWALPKKEGEEGKLVFEDYHSFITAEKSLLKAHLAGTPFKPLAQRTLIQVTSKKLGTGSLKQAECSERLSKKCAKIAKKLRELTPWVAYRFTLQPLDPTSFDQKGKLKPTRKGTLFTQSLFVIGWIELIERIDLVVSSQLIGHLNGYGALSSSGQEGVMTYAALLSLSPLEKAAGFALCLGANQNSDQDLYMGTIYAEALMYSVVRELRNLYQNQKVHLESAAGSQHNREVICDLLPTVHVLLQCNTWDIPQEPPEVSNPAKNPLLHLTTSLHLIAKTPGIETIMIGGFTRIENVIDISRLIEKTIAQAYPKWCSQSSDAKKITKKESQGTVGILEAIRDQARSAQGLSPKESGFHALCKRFSAWGLTCFVLGEQSLVDGSVDVTYDVDVAEREHVTCMLPEQVYQTLQNVAFSAKMAYDLRLKTDWIRNISMERAVRPYPKNSQNFAAPPNATPALSAKISQTSMVLPSAPTAPASAPIPPPRPPRKGIWDANSVGFHEFVSTKSHNGA